MPPRQSGYWQSERHCADERDFSPRTTSDASFKDVISALHFEWFRYSDGADF
jgi:hypothetical protein